MKNSFLFFACIFFLNGCKKTDNTLQLPPITHIGANILGCKVNGKIAVVSGSQRNSFSSFGVNYNPPSSTGLIFIAANSEKPRYNIDISFRFFDTTGSYPIEGVYPYVAYYWDFSNGTLPTGNIQFSTDSLHTGIITVLYYDASVISGTFAFDAVNDHDSVVHITEGRFDLVRDK